MIKFSLVTSWLLISLVLLFVLIAPYLLSSESVLNLAPACEWKVKYNTECYMCGMTRSFILISYGHFSEAHDRNKGSIPLYLLFLANQLCALFYAIGVLRKRCRASRSVQCCSQSNPLFNSIPLSGGQTCKPYV